MKKIAIVGIGKIAQDQHVPAIANSGDWELAATYAHEGSVEGVDAFSSFDALLNERSDIETVSFCLPPAPRFEYAAKALKAGRNVMLEKPPGATLAECYRLEAIAREANVSLYTTWHSREADGVDGAKAWLADKTVRAVRIVWKEDVRRWHPGQDWIFAAGGFGIFDPIINALSIMTEIMSDPVHVTSADLNFPENCETPISGTMAFFHPGGASVTVEMDFLKQGEQIWTIEIDTDAGLLVLSEGGATLTLNGERVSTDDAQLSGEGNGDGTNALLGGEYVRLYEKMAALVREGRSDVDLTPMIHVADACLLGHRHTVKPFHWGSG